MASLKRKSGKSAGTKATTAKTARAKTTKAKSVKVKAVKAKTAKPKAVKAKTVKAKTAKAKTVKAKTVKPKADQNRRRFDRRDTRINAQLDHDGTVTKGTVTNLSLAGCLFEPQLKIAIGSRVKLKLAGETPVAATVKAVSEQGVHCLLHAGGVTLGRLSADLDDMALLMLNAGRPHEIAPPAMPVRKRAK